MIARGRRIFATDSFVVATNTTPHMVDGRRLPEAMNVAGPGEQMGCVRPPLLRQRSRFERSKEFVDFNFGCRQRRHSLPLRVLCDQCSAETTRRIATLGLAR